MGELCKLPHRGLARSPRSSATLSFLSHETPFICMAVLPDDDCRANYFGTVVTNQRLGLHFLFNERHE